MTEAQGLIETDRLATLSVNGSDSLYWDGVADMYTSVIVWIPLAVIAILLLIRNITPKRLILVLCLVALTVVLTDQLSSSVFKPLFQRLRPTRDPLMLDMIDTVMVIVEVFMDSFRGMQPILSGWRCFSCGL